MPKQKRLLILLVLLVVLPSLPIAWYAHHSWKSEQQIIDVQFEKLVRARLLTIDDRIHSYLNELGNSLGNHIDSAFAAGNDIYEQLQNHPHVSEAIVIDASGNRVLPPREEMLTNRQHKFIERISDLLRDPDMLFQPREELPGPAASDRVASAPARDAAEQSVSSQIPRKGTRGRWYADFTGALVNLVYWYRPGDGSIVGLQLNRSRLISDFISLLPDTVSRDDALANSRIRLIDDNGEILYQWGLFDPMDSQTDQTLSMSYPLSSWKLEYFGKLPRAETGYGWISWLPPVLILVSVLAGLALFLYREHNRETRLAAQKVQFVSQVSHELKTPLTNIRLYAEMLEKNVPQGKPKDYADIIINESRRLTRLIANILNFTRQPKLHPVITDVDDVISGAIERFRLLLTNRGVAIHRTGRIGTPQYLDPDALDQILNNLLGNVEKYAYQGGRVDIDAVAEKGHFRIRIQDYGPGIPNRERHNVFKPFYRVNNKINEGVAGTGIGLYLSRQLARLMGGDLRLLTSDSGALFELKLPLGRGES